MIKILIDLICHYFSGPLSLPESKFISLQNLTFLMIGLGYFDWITWSISINPNPPSTTLTNEAT